MRRTNKAVAEDEAQIDLTPMLDVVFIMLIFFIVTASFIKEAGIEVSRPEASTSQPKENVNILVAISATNVSTLAALTEVFSQASGKAHLTISPSDASDQGFPEEALDRISAVGNVAALVPVVRGQASLADEASPAEMELSMFGAATGGLVPDLTLLYDVPPALGLERRERAAGDTNRLDREPAEFHARVRRRYLDLAAAAPRRWVVLDGAAAPDELERCGWAALEARLAGPAP